MARTKKKKTKGQLTGGMTGSRAVKVDGQTYQEKASLHGKLNTRSLKAGFSDRENLGEALAAPYVKAYLGEGYAPDVETSYDPEHKKVEILSKYLEHASLTMDKFYTEHINPSLGKKKHVQIVLTSEADENPPAGEWQMHPDDPLAKSLARTLAVAAIIGDADVNPGNRMVIDKPGEPLEIASIDFGHAFNDLIHAPAVVGGRIRTRMNPVFDFFNRTSVADARPGGSISKFWRDYRGFLPSELLGNALIEVGENIQAQTAGLEAAKQEFTELFELLNQHDDDESKAYVLKSFNQIHHAITGEFFPSDSTDKQKVVLLFETIERFIQKNVENAVQAGHMMRIQAELDAALNKEVDDLEALTDNYRAQLKQHSLMDEYDVMQCPWFRRSLTEKPFKGSLENYIAYKNSQYLNKIKEQANIPKLLQSLRIQIQKLMEYITAYFKPELELEKDTGIEMQTVDGPALLKELRADLHEVERKLPPPDSDDATLV